MRAAVLDDVGCFRRNVVRVREDHLRIKQSIRINQTRNITCRELNAINQMCRHSLDTMLLGPTEEILKYFFRQKPQVKGKADLYSPIRVWCIAGKFLKGFDNPRLEGVFVEGEWIPRCNPCNGRVSIYTTDT